MSTFNVDAFYFWSFEMLYKSTRLLVGTAVACLLALAFNS